MKPKNCGRKKIQVDLSTVPDIPLNRRGTIRSLANALGVNKSSLHRSFKQGLLQRHSNSLKPYLKEANKKSRLQWCVSMLEPSTLPNNPKFKEMKKILSTQMRSGSTGQERIRLCTCIQTKKTHTGQCKTRMPFTKSCFILELHSLGLMLKVDVILMAN